MSRSPFVPVRVGVIGLGRFGRLHSLTLNGLAEAELVAVVARRQDSVDALCRELPHVPGWVDLDAAVRDSGAEAWVVACSTSQHVAVTRTLLEAGKTVLLEKPVAETLSEAERLAPLIRSDRPNLMMGHIILFNSEFRQLREEVSRRGGLQFLDCVRHRPASIVRDFPGENPLQATMVHDLYAAQALTNRAEPVGFGCWYHRAEVGSVDLATATLRWDDGTLATFTASYMTPAGMAPRGFDRTEAFGRGWAARINTNPRPVEVWDEQARWPMPLEIRADREGPSGMMAEELRCFCRVVRGIEPPPIGATYADAMQVQRWMERLHEVATQK